MQAQTIPLGTGMGLDPDVTVSGTLSTAADVDMFKATLTKGDMIGLACHVTSPTDSVVAVLDSMGTIFFSNDDHGGIDSLYPPGSPWPVGTDPLDTALTFVVPLDGDYILRVTAANAGGAGAYQLQIRLRRAAIEAQYPTPLRQILFIDFDGATVPASALFGSGRTSATLSPLSSFLSGWGLAPADENAVINAILATIQQRFDALRQMSLNGDFPGDMMPGHFDIEIRNSRDDPDPFGQANVSRVVVGGTEAQLGIDTIGIAEWIDPGNYSQADTAVCLLDLLSAAASNPNSVNSIPRAGGFTIFDAVGLIVGNVVCHEAGHFLGNWHTRNDNGVICLMDAGGDLPNLAGAGADGTLGNGDDVVSSFRSDAFDLSEQVGSGQEKTDFTTAFGLSTGGLAADAMPPTLMSRTPNVGEMIASLPSVSVTFNEFVAVLQGADITVNGSPATSVSGSGAGPFAFSGFAVPPDGTVTIILGAGGGITDLSGNAFAMVTWSVDVHDCNLNGAPDSIDISGGGSRDCPANGIPDECEPGSLNALPGSSQTINPGQAVVTNASPAAGGTPPYTFAWTFTGPGVSQNSTDAVPSFTPQMPGDFTVQLQVMDAVPCTVTASFNVTVPAPAMPAGGGDGGAVPDMPSTTASPQCGLCGAGGTMGVLWMIACIGGMACLRSRGGNRQA